MMNAAAGIFLAARRKKGWTNPYVTDGLVAMWDGEWNVAGGVHDATATSWKDLVGSNDARIAEGGSWGSSYLACDGVACGAICANIQPGSVGTIECVVSGIDTSNQGIILGVCQRVDGGSMYVAFETI